jgi:hypothetical protein
MGLDSSKTHIPFRIAVERITHTDIKGWRQMRFRESLEIETDRGEFPCTLIKLVDSDILCSWPMKKFEEELRKFLEKYEAFAESQALKYIIQEIEATEKK